MSATLDHRIDSATGVEVSLPIAGVGARAYAFVIDWHIRAVLGIAWFVVSALAWNAIFESRLSIRAPVEDSVAWFLIVLLPSSAIYFFYHPVLEAAMRGRTPGKRIAGVRLVTTTGGTPGMGALLLRNVFRLIDSLPALYALGLASAVLSHQHRRLGDFAAGTLLVYDRHLADDFADLAWSPRPALRAEETPLDAERRELAEQLRRRWPRMAPAARRALALRLLDGRIDSDALAAADDPALLSRISALAQREDDTRPRAAPGGFQ